MRFSTLVLLANLGWTLAAPASPDDEQAKQLADSLKVPNNDEFKTAIKSNKGDGVERAKRACKLAKVVFKDSGATVPKYLDAENPLYADRIKVNW